MDESFKSLKMTNLNNEFKNEIAELNKKLAVKLMALKAEGRIFCEDNAPAMCSCKIEPKKITIYGFNNDKFEIEL